MKILEKIKDCKVTYVALESECSCLGCCFINEDECTASNKFICDGYTRKDNKNVIWKRL